MNIGIPNWHIWSINYTKMSFLTLFQYDTQLLTSKHLKIFSKYHEELNGAILKTCFSAPQNANKIISNW